VLRTLTGRELAALIHLLSGEALRRSSH
jgi:hypothetical protein